MMSLPSFCHIESSLPLTLDESVLLNPLREERGEREEREGREREEDKFKRVTMIITYFRWLTTDY